MILYTQTSQKNTDSLSPDCLLAMQSFWFYKCIYFINWTYAPESLCNL